MAITMAAVERQKRNFNLLGIGSSFIAVFCRNALSSVVPGVGLKQMLSKANIGEINVLQIVPTGQGFMGVRHARPPVVKGQQLPKRWGPPRCADQIACRELRFQI